MQPTVSKEEKQAMLNKLAAARLINTMPSEDHEKAIWSEAYALYNKGRGTNLTDLRCSKCANMVLEWLQE